MSQTKDRRVLNIKDMETSHIKNTMKLIERNGFEFIISTGIDDTKSHSIEEISLRGKYQTMKKELEKRELNK